MSSRDRASIFEALPYPTNSRNGSPMRRTDLVKLRRASAWRNPWSCISESSEPMAYAQPVTDRKIVSVTHIRCAGVKSCGSSPNPIVVAV
jgi:hypothetical protein